MSLFVQKWLVEMPRRGAIVSILVSLKQVNWTVNSIVAWRSIFSALCHVLKNRYNWLGRGFFSHSCWVYFCSRHVATQGCITKPALLFNPYMGGEKWIYTFYNSYSKLLSVTPNLLEYLNMRWRLEENWFNLRFNQNYHLLQVKTLFFSSICLVTSGTEQP